MGARGELRGSGKREGGPVRGREGEKGRDSQSITSPENEWTIAPIRHSCSHLIAHCNLNNSLVIVMIILIAWLP